MRYRLAMHRLALVLVFALACGGTPSATEATSGETSTATEGSTSASEPTTSTTDAPPTTEASADGTTFADASTSADDSSGDVPLPGFAPQPCLDASPDVRRDRLCDEAADPANAPDEIDITCRLESSCQGEPAGAPVDRLRVLAWNIERGGSLDGQLQAFATGALPMPDVLLLGEVDRGCLRTGHRNVAWEYATALGMHHAYGVEFVELPRPDGSIDAPCEHGNAILSRYPLGNVELVRHADNESWYETDEPRLGGRMALRADVHLGDRMAHVVVVHFESGVEDGARRANQAAEVADMTATLGRPVIVGGDTNAGLYVLDLALGTHNEGTTEAFFERGFVDAHLALPNTQRATRPPLVLDLIFTLDGTPIDPVVCAGELCDGLSDHRAVWVDVALP
jgi:endonuclease/exonuclease/phosphatase family metal-dependent hydrolase